MTTVKSNSNHAENPNFDTAHLLGDVSGKSIRGASVTMGAQVIKFVLQMVSTITLARLLTPQDFGLVAMVTVITGFVAMFNDCGLSIATIQRDRITQAQVSSLFWINCGLGFALTLIVASLAPAIGWFYNDSRLILITWVLSGTFFLSGLAVQHLALLRRAMKFKVLAIIEVLSMMIGIIIGIGMAMLGFEYWSLVGSSFGAAIANCILIWFFCQWRPGSFALGVGARPMVIFGANITGFNVLNYFVRNFHNILIGHVLGPVATGLYNKAYGLLSLPISQINGPINGVMIPALSRLQNNPVEYARLYLVTLAILSAATVPITVCSFVLAKDIIEILLGAQWISVVPIFQLLAPAALAGAINVAPGWLCVSLGRPHLQVRYGYVAAPVCITALVIGIKWGLTGVAVGFSLAFTSLFWGFAWYASKGSPVMFSSILGVFISALVPSIMAGLISWIVRWQILASESVLFAFSASLLCFGFTYITVAICFQSNRVVLYWIFNKSKNILFRHSEKEVSTKD